MLDSLAERLASFGSACIARIIAAGPNRRSAFLREGIPQDLIEEFYGRERSAHVATLVDAYRIATDAERQAETTPAAARSLDPLRDAELFRRSAYTSTFSGQDIAERAG